MSGSQGRDYVCFIISICILFLGIKNLKIKYCNKYFEVGYNIHRIDKLSKTKITCFLIASKSNALKVASSIISSLLIKYRKIHGMFPYLRKN